MLKKFVLWFIVFGLSFFVQNVLGWAEQGQAFVMITFIALVVILLSVIIYIRDAKDSFELIVTFAVLSGITIFFTWIATQLFSVSFEIAFQLITFGMCMSLNSK